jgi:hypothetical protein
MRGCLLGRPVGARGRCWRSRRLPRRHDESRPQVPVTWEGVPGRTAPTSHVVLELLGGIGLIATRGTQALRIRTIIRGVLGMVSRRQVRRGTAELLVSSSPGSSGCRISESAEDIATLNCMVGQATASSMRPFRWASVPEAHRRSWTSGPTADQSGMMTTLPTFWPVST